MICGDKNISNALIFLWVYVLQRLRDYRAYTVAHLIEIAELYLSVTARNKSPFFSGYLSRLSGGYFGHSAPWRPQPVLQPFAYMILTCIHSCPPGRVPASLFQHPVLSARSAFGRKNFFQDTLPFSSRSGPRSVEGLYLMMSQEIQCFSWRHRSKT